MKYVIETTENGCIETLEFQNGMKFEKKTNRTDFGCETFDENFAEQLEKQGFDEEIIEKVYDAYDGFGASHFLDIAKLEDMKG